MAVGLSEKAKDKAEELEGEVKERIGKATDDQSLEAEGKGHKVKGNLKQSAEKIRDTFKS
jgi:uncharacterized protein YjbJ (UPF0337 family)